ncbi:cupredoxin domain-containing protein [Streptomyces sp. YIM S03343]
MKRMNGMIHTARTAPMARSRRAAISISALAFTGALALAACGGGGGGGSHASSSPTTAKAGAGTQVTVTETEYHLKLSRSAFTPGTYTFTAHNAGTATHALELDGPGVEDVRTNNLQAGQTGTLTVTFKKGSYKMYCPVDGHKQLGMMQTIQVT